MKRIALWMFVGWGVWAGAEAARGAEKIPTAAQVASPTQQALDQAASQGKYTFLVFYREDNPTTRAMGGVVAASVKKNASASTMVWVPTTSPQEQAVISRFGASRSPLPMTIAVAPNGAIMGVFSQKVTTEQIEGSFATPVMMHCMKALQEGKLAFVCVQSAQGSPLPAAVNDFRADPDFKNRTAVITVAATDTAETDFYQQMQIDAAKVRGTTMVVFAPPSAMVGKFDGAATKAQIIAALHKAGKCCDDPNCKHGQAAAPAATKR